MPPGNEKGRPGKPRSGHDRAETPEIGCDKQEKSCRHIRAVRAPKPAIDAQRGQDSQTSHFVTYQPLRKLSLRSQAVPASTKEIGSPIGASLGSGETETGNQEQRQRALPTQYAAFSAKI